MNLPVLFSIKKQMSDFEDIETAPKDGTIIFIMDQFGHIDLACWDHGGWNAEFGVCDEPEMWAKFHIHRR